MQPRVLVLVLSIDREPWRRIETEGIRKTWAAPSSLDQLVSVLFYQGTARGLRYWTVGGISRLMHLAARENQSSLASRTRIALIRGAARRFLPGEVFRSGDTLTTSVPETYGMLSAKLWAALSYVHSHQGFEFILRTNSSTYVDRARLARFVASLPPTGYYGGKRGESSGIVFASGTGILMSRDVVKEALEGTWDHAKPDDVALGEVLANRGVNLQAIDRPELRVPSDAWGTDTDAFMWRCKGSLTDRHDVETMLELYAMLSLEAGSSRDLLD